MRSLSEIAVRDEAKEVWLGSRPKTTQMVADRSPQNRIETGRGARGSGLEERAVCPTGSLRPSLWPRASRLNIGDCSRSAHDSSGPDSAVVSYFGIGVT